jgi:hypothetical protein
MLTQMSSGFPVQSVWQRLWVRVPSVSLICDSFLLMNSIQVLRFTFGGGELFYGWFYGVVGKIACRAMCNFVPRARYLHMVQEDITDINHRFRRYEYKRKQI